MTSSSLPRGIWVPLVTPFADGAVDHAGLGRLVESLAARGVAGFVVCGSTGEAAVLSAEEQRAVLRTVLSAANGLPAIVGLGGVATGDVREALLSWAESPIAGFLITAPYYVKPSQAGLVEHFVTLADASPLPIVLYDIAARTGVRIETGSMLQLAAHPRIVGVKDCSDDLDHLQAVLNDGRLAVFCGNDHHILASLALGASGAVAASAHLRPELFVQLQRHVDRGELPQARGLWARLWPLVMALFAEPNPAPLKAALAELHGLSDELRAPMTPASEPVRARVAQALAALRAA